MSEANKVQIVKHFKIDSSHIVKEEGDTFKLANLHLLQVDAEDWAPITIRNRRLTPIITSTTDIVKIGEYAYSVVSKSIVRVTDYNISICQRIIADSSCISKDSCYFLQNVMSMLYDDASTLICVKAEKTDSGSYELETDVNGNVFISMAGKNVSEQVKTLRDKISKELARELILDFMLYGESDVEKYLKRVF